MDLLSRLWASLSPVTINIYLNDWRKITNHRGEMDRAYQNEPWPKKFTIRHYRDTEKPPSESGQTWCVININFRPDGTDREWCLFINFNIDSEWRKVPRVQIASKHKFYHIIVTRYSVLLCRKASRHVREKSHTFTGKWWLNVTGRIK